MFSPAKIKADLIFIASLVAVFGFKLPDSVSVALIGSAGLIAAGLNLGDSLLTKYAPTFLPSVLGEVKKGEADVGQFLPLLLPVLNELPGKIGAEVKTALEAIEHGPSEAGKVGASAGTVKQP